MRLAYAPYMLKFKAPAGTSRGILYEKPTYLLKIYDENDPDRFGIGEASVFPGLSPEADGRYEYKIVELLANVALGHPTDLTRYSSLQLGLEEAIRDFSSGCRGIYFDSPFTAGQSELTINGLVWMGSFDEMMVRLEEKIQSGFKCIKLKIGSIQWEKEVALLKTIRSTYNASQLMIRVDANGGFTPDNVRDRLEQLARYDVHSIEQPLPKGMVGLTAALCQDTPVPIALDEELIGIYETEEKIAMLNAIAPQYIILKPTLCGGFNGSREWISLAQERSIGWWITSALESNVGLNAIAQFAASLNVKGPQGLGTGNLYVNNFSSPLRLEGENLIYDRNSPSDYSQFNELDWRE